MTNIPMRAKIQQFERHGYRATVIIGETYPNSVTNITLTRWGARRWVRREFAHMRREFMYRDTPVEMIDEDGGRVPFLKRVFSNLRHGSSMVKGGDG